MLHVIEKDYVNGTDDVQRWHVGEPLPEITHRVVTFQADGDELEMIVAAMIRTRIVKVNL